MKIHISYNEYEIDSLDFMLDCIKCLPGKIKLKQDGNTGRMHLYFVQKNSDRTSNDKGL